ncbi:hypothetical protein ACZ90_43645 [Streptomyces albus subsp. albus]|nr:hypothetical protein ACZ90_43645 [Streptomyces albus subsp. albus]
MKFHRGPAWIGPVLLIAALGLPAGAAQAHTPGQAPVKAGTADGPASSTASAGVRPATPAPRPAAAPGEQVITFSEVPLETAVTKQYQPRGIVFAGSGGGGTPFTSQDGANPTAPVLSGNPRFHGGIQGTFVKVNGKKRTVSRFRVDVGYIDTPGTVAVSAYDLKGRRIAQQVVDRTGVVPVTVQAAGIASFRVDEVAGEAAGFAIDNLTYAQPRTLASLGDSYSSGEAAPPYDSGTGGRSGCHRSANAWPRLLGRNNEAIKQVKHFACSGAEIPALEHSFKRQAPQLTSLGNLKGADEPAYVSMTLGGNDAGFADILTNCWLPLHNCSDNGTIGRAERKLPALQRQLAAAYQKVQKKAPNATVVIVGYPRLFPNTAREEHCGWLADNERSGLNRLAGKLDRMLAAAADKAGVEYVSVLQTLNKHELCARDSWVHPINVIDGQEQAHPKLPGQRAIEAVVRKAVNNL